MGLFPGVVAYIAWSYVLSKIPASQAGSYLALIPVAALLIAWLWLGEVPSPISLMGGAVVFCGVMLVFFCGSKGSIIFHSASLKLLEYGIGRLILFTPTL
jgi:threonine/homoserine efflux transporter RhtA